MKTLSVVGILLVVLGLFALAYGGFSYTKKETVIDLGPIEASTETRETIPLPPILGGVALVAGIVLLVKASKTAA